MNIILCLQFCDAFFVHLSPHWFDVSIKGECEAMITLDVHPKWIMMHVNVVNIFNIIIHMVIFSIL